MTTKLLRIEGPMFVVGAEIAHDHGFTFIKREAPFFRRIRGNMSVAELMEFLDGSAKRVGWTYRWMR